MKGVIWELVVAFINWLLLAKTTSMEETIIFEMCYRCSSKVQLSSVVCVYKHHNSLKCGVQRSAQHVLLDWSCTENNPVT